LIFLMKPQSVVRPRVLGSECIASERRFLATFSRDLHLEMVMS
jgi:hypothetical protein